MTCRTSSGVRGGDHVGTRRVHLRVDREGGAVHRPVALDDVALVVDEDEVGDADLLRSASRTG